MPRTDALADLTERLALLRLRLARHVALLRAAGRFNEDPFRGLYVSDAEADAAMEDAPPTGPWAARAEALAARIAAAEARLLAREAADPALPFPALLRGFGLGAAEGLAVLLAAAAAFEPRFATLFAYAQNDAAARQPTLGLLLDLAAPDAQGRAATIAALAPGAPLRAFRLLAPPPPEFREDARPAMPLIADAALLPLLLGNPDAALDAALRPQPPLPAADDPALDAATARLAAQVAATGPREPCVAALIGPEDAGQALLAQAAAAARGLALLALDPGHPQAQALDDATLAALCGRALRLAGAALFLPAGLEGMRLHALLRAAARPGAPVFIADTVPPDPALLPAGTALLEVALPAPDETARRRWWGAALRQAAAPEAFAPVLARGTRLGPLGIARAIARARRVEPDWPPAEATPIADAARRGAGPALTRLAQQVTMRQGWNELVLPAAQQEELDLLVAAATHGARLSAWGYPAASALVALFGGASGTGKSMAAGLVAQRAGLPLWRIDLSTVVSKYIGDTEKQLDLVLREAQAVGAALLFDEADALFGKRAEVKDARDRYANQEVAFLLQRIEAFDGLVILTTNLGGHIDPAFLRRIAHAVHFPMPDVTMREALWRGAFPAAAPLADDMDLALLARSFEIAGGNIRCAALGAAQMAAAEAQPAIGLQHALRAVSREMRKLGRLPSRAEAGALQAAMAADRAA